MPSPPSALAINSHIDRFYIAQGDGAALMQPATSSPAPPALGAGDLGAVFRCLQSALSHDSTTQKQAEAALRELETRPGFCSCLAVRWQDRREWWRWL